VVAVYGATCQLRSGDGVALTGPSGSGKSTLLHLMAGLDVPTVGSVRWPALGSPRGPAAGQLGFVFQAPSLIPALDVIENVALPLVLAGRTDALAQRSAQAVLQRLGLADVTHHLPDELSGGQAQRVALARGLVGNPPIVLADEPTGQLDGETARAVVDALVEAAADGAAVLVATHDQRVAGRFSEQWSMSDGRLETAEDRVCSA
jgi:putative ABC transport system ATP-binding protein